MLTDEQRAVLESLACMSSPYENEILRSILANEKASAIHLDNVAIERARDAWFDNSGSFESRLRAAISAASAAPADEDSISIQEAWEAAGGNPGIKATRDDSLIALQDLDAAVDELSAAPAERRETADEKFNPYVEPEATTNQTLTEAIEWCIAHGNCGPRTRATLIAARSALATAPTISEAAISIVRKVRDTFRRDMEQGFVTKDKQFAVEMLSQALAEIERIDRAAAKGRSDGPASD
jgi:hypothetical protein